MTTVDCWLGLEPGTFWLGIDEATRHTSALYWTHQVGPVRPVPHSNGSTYTMLSRCYAISMLCGYLCMPYMLMLRRRVFAMWLASCYWSPNGGCYLIAWNPSGVLCRGGQGQRPVCHLHRWAGQCGGQEDRVSHAPLLQTDHQPAAGWDGRVGPHTVSTWLSYGGKVLWNKHLALYIELL